MTYEQWYNRLDFLINRAWDPERITDWQQLIDIDTLFHDGKTPLVAFLLIVDHKFGDEVNPTLLHTWLSPEGIPEDD